MTPAAFVPAAWLPWTGPIAAMLALAAAVLAVVSLTRHPAPALPAVPAPDGAWRELEQRVRGLETDLPLAIQRLGLVRFDAFPGSGGQFSFSAALLDARNNGIVLTAISGREETRLYAKRLNDGVCQQPLSPEESDAVQRALGLAAGGGR